MSPSAVSVWRRSWTVEREQYIGRYVLALCLYGGGDAELTGYSISVDVSSTVCAEEMMEG